MPTGKLNATQRGQLMETLERRFMENMHRHIGISFEEVSKRLMDQPDKAWSLWQMDITGGAPDLIVMVGKMLYADCSVETPTGRRSLCYDQEALNARKEAKPKSSAMQMASEMGIDLMDEDQYRYLQTLGAFDLKTSSWLRTPAPVRQLGGAIFGDRRYDRVFTYHNGVQSYYAARGFRGIMMI